MSSQDETPTSSQPTMSWMRLGADTRTSIPPANSVNEAKNQVNRTSPSMYPLA